MTIFFVMLMRPLAAFFIVYTIARPVADFIWQKMPDGRWKRILFFSWNI